MIEKTADEDPEFSSHINVMKRMSQLRFKDVLKETLAELERKGRNFVCIYPAPGCEVYDKFFTQLRPLNKFLSRVLFHDELNFASASLPPKSDTNVPCASEVSSPAAAADLSQNKKTQS